MFLPNFGVVFCFVFAFCFFVGVLDTDDVELRPRRSRHGVDEGEESAIANGRFSLPTNVARCFAPTAAPEPRPSLRSRHGEHDIEESVASKFTVDDIAHELLVAAATRK